MREFSIYLTLFFLFSASTLTIAEEPLTTDYKVGTDDVLDISVLQPEKMLVTATVSPDGSITFPYIGNIEAKDKTLAQIQDTIQTKLADGYMMYPVVSVSLREVRSKKFFVYGEVTKPDTYLITDKDTTVMKAITMAGGFTKYGSSGSVKVLRPKKTGTGCDTINVDIKSANDIPIQPGDTVVVSEGKFFVYGDVNRPGGYPIEENTSALKAISTAGGFLREGTSNKVRVLRPRKDSDKKDSLDVDIKAAMSGSSESDIMLQPGDTVTVSGEKYFVYGEVNRPGSYPLEANTTVVKAILTAGGFTKYGSSSRVKILRPEEKGQGNETLKVNMKAALDGASKEDTPLKSGDTVVVSEGVF